MANAHVENDLLRDEHVLARILETKIELPLLMLEVDFREGEVDREVALDETWEATINMIAAAKVWIDGLQDIHYRQPARYLQQVRGYNQEASLKLSKRIRRARYVFNGFRIIIVNLNKFPIIDRRGMSMVTLEKCKSLAWVTKYAAQFKEKGEKPANPRWEDEDFRELVNVMITSKAFMSVRDNPNMASDLLHKASLECLSWTSMQH